MPYNKLLTNLACLSRTGEYWPSVVFVRTPLHLVRTATTSGQYSVSKRLVFYVFSPISCEHELNYRLQAVPFWIVKVARNSRARKNWSELAWGGGGGGRCLGRGGKKGGFVCFSSHQSRCARLTRKGLLAV